jgi:hypothetical protein
MNQLVRRMEKRGQGVDKDFFRRSQNEWKIRMLQEQLHSVRVIKYSVIAIATGTRRDAAVSHFLRSYISLCGGDGRLTTDRERPPFSPAAPTMGHNES